MDVAATLEDLATLVRGVDGIRAAYAEWPDQIVTPSALISFADIQLSPRIFAGRPGGPMALRTYVTLLAAPIERAGIVRAQAELWPFLAATGASSVLLALGEYLNAETPVLLGTFEVNGVEYVGAQIPVEVIG